MTEPSQSNSASSSHHSVTSLIQLVKDQDPNAAAEIWNRYLSQLLRVATVRMKGTSRAATDEEDVMVSVFDRFFDQAGKGNFQQLDDRNDLWYILVMLTERKIIDRHRRESAEKRGAGNVVAEVDMVGITDSSDAIGFLQEMVEGDRSPDYILAFNELLRKALDEIEEPIARQVVEMALAGHSKHDIADKLDISVRTVERKLEVIREIWRDVFGEWL